MKPLPTDARGLNARVMDAMIADLWDGRDNTFQRTNAIRELLLARASPNLPHPSPIPPKKEAGR